MGRVRGGVGSKSLLVMLTDTDCIDRADEMLMIES